MSADWTPDDEDLLRRALREEASRIVPDSDALSRIQERTQLVPWWRRPLTWTLAIATATAAATVAVVMLDIGQSGTDPDRADVIANEPPESTDDAPQEDAEDSDADEDPAVISAPSDETATQLPDNVPEAEAEQVVPVAAYYLAETPMGPRLAREFREARLGENLPETALTVMFGEPLDPDYSNPWDSATEFSVIETPGVIEVDLVFPEETDVVPDDVGELAIQQLVYTVQGAVQRPDTVRFLLDGEPADELWGVDVSGGVARAPQLDVRQLVQINNPNEGDTKTSPVVISGEAALYEANYEWRIEQNGDVIEEGFDQSAEGQTFAPFSFEVELEPGDYVVFVTASDPSGGEEGPGPMSDSRSFTVPPSQ